jgi:hypothetical protein
MDGVINDVDHRVKAADGEAAFVFMALSWIVLVTPLVSRSRVRSGIRQYEAAMEVIHRSG